MGGFKYIVLDNEGPLSHKGRKPLLQIFKPRCYWTTFEIATVIQFMWSFDSASLMPELRDMMILPWHYLSTAMATKVKTEAETDMPWTIPLILQTMLPNGQPGEKIEITYWEMILAKLYRLIHINWITLLPVKNDLERVSHYIFTVELS